MQAEQRESWRVILFTDLPFIAAQYKTFLAEEGHRLIGVVTSSKRSTTYLDVVRAVQPEVDVLVSNHPRRWAAMLAPLRPDLIISNVFPLRIPADVLALPRLGAVNLHATLLPRYRGTMSTFWQLRNGERETGATLHRMTTEFDNGPILAQTRFVIEDDDDFGSWRRKVHGILPTLWALAAPRLARGDPGDPQDEALASYFGKIEDEASWKSIDWTLPARTVHNVVRSSAWEGAQPPGAVGLIDGVPHRITKTQLLTDTAGDGPMDAVERRADGTIMVRCGDGPLAILAASPV